MHIDVHRYIYSWFVQLWYWPVEFQKSNKLTLVYLLCLMFNIVYTYDREIQKC